MADSRRLQGKRALVTGGGSGIGRATGLRFAAEGARVAFLDLDEAAVASAAEEAGPGALALVADVGDERGVEGAFARVLDDWGGLEVVVANAGIELQGVDAPVDRLARETWQRIIDVNLTGVFHTCKYGIRALRMAGGGSLICTVSPTSLYAQGPGEHAYSASKAGVYGLMKVMAADYAAEGIRVNAVMPGFTDTPLNRPVVGDKAELAGVIADIPLRRAGTAEEVAGAMTFLAADESAYAVGSTVVVDGGLTAV